LAVFGLWFAQLFVNQTNRKMKFLDKLPEPIQSLIAIVGFALLLSLLLWAVYAVA